MSFKNNAEYMVSIYIYQKGDWSYFFLKNSKRIWGQSNSRVDREIALHLVVVGLILHPIRSDP